jgi:predicted Abi (CAAX) family protease
MKERSWWVVVLCTIAMWWGWLSPAKILADLTPPISAVPLVVSAVNDNSPRWRSPSERESSLSNIQNANYRPNGEWIGRLILPSQEEIEKSTLTDWVWVEIKHAPELNRSLIGKQVHLTWQPQSDIQANARQVTTDVRFTAETIASQRKGNIHPQRLNGRLAVGALQSLAGARPVDDILVRLTGVNIGTETGSEGTVLRIDREPIQITGTLTGLVKIIGTNQSQTPLSPSDCNLLSCPNEYFQVQNYNSTSRNFDGKIERIRIPQMPAKQSGLLPSSIRDLERSPAGNQGWYIYGDRDPQGLLAVAAIQPRSLFTLTPQQEIVDADAKFDYLDRQHWQNTPHNKGKLSQVKFVGTSAGSHPAAALGTRALVIHSFGGIGGKTGDAADLWQTITGHFAYGMATVARSTFTGEPEWQVEYNQVYAHNPDGIVAGKQDWATYQGHLQRGWLATRPVSDLLIIYPPVTENYDFGGIELSPLTELQRQLNIFAARYRTGDGTGSASVTPATSCVQDANQALYVTIRQLTRQVVAQPAIQAWLAAHPHEPQTLRFRELQSLGVELENTLAPLGIVRSDWQQNAAKLAGIQVGKGFSSSNNPIAGLVSWRTMLPRGAQDGIAKIFTRQGATIWFLNTAQVGGSNPDIFPIAPTIVFGQVPIIATLIVRIWAGLVTLPNLGGWLLGLGLLIGYAVIALAIGFRSKFLTFTPESLHSWQGLLPQIRSWIALLLMPALVEELVFRLLLIPHPIETAPSLHVYGASLISLILFIGYHPFNARTFYSLGNPTFMDWRFLTLTCLLGGVCTISYLATSSIWVAVMIHWLVVGVWLKFLGGSQRLAASNVPRLMPHLQ